MFRCSKKYLLLAAILCAKEKPPMHWFLKPVIDRLNQLSTEGMYMSSHSVDVLIII